MRFAVSFKQTDQRFQIGFRNDNQHFTAAFANLQKVTVTPESNRYTGSYEVTPKVAAQSLETKNKFLTDNVTVHEIPYFDVGNTSGGSTVYIGTLDEMLAVQ